ncbi:MAG: hypothetical protein SFV81_19145, partial [Pirellulaceae bacterium]|nr:hypothetical protein [Pirellulaceae bacterium]
MAGTIRPLQKKVAGTIRPAARLQKVGGTIRHGNPYLLSMNLLNLDGWADFSFCEDFLGCTEFAAQVAPIDPFNP